MIAHLFGWLVLVCAIGGLIEWLVWLRRAVRWQRERAKFEPWELC